MRIFDNNTLDHSVSIKISLFNENVHMKEPRILIPKKKRFLRRRTDMCIMRRYPSIVAGESSGNDNEEFGIQC